MIGPDAALLGDLIALLSAVCWAGTSILARMLSQWIAPAWCNTLRWVVGLVCLIPFAVLTFGSMRLETVTPTNVGLLALSVISGMGIGDTVAFISMRRIGVSRSMPVAGTHPIITALVAAVAFGEQLSPVRLGGVLLVGVSIWVLTGERAASEHPLTRRDALVGYGLAALAAFGWAGSGLFAQPVVRTMDVMLATVIRVPMAVAFMLAAMALTGRRVARPVLGRRAAVLLVLLGVLTIASTTVFLAAVAITGAARTAAVTSVSPLLAALLAVWLLGERVTPRLLIAIGVVSVGLVAVILG